MQMAARRLSATPDPIARIAFDAGYDSEAAFSRAFKRAFGVPPAAWRRSKAMPDGERPAWYKTPRGIQAHRGRKIE